MPTTLVDYTLTSFPLGSNRHLISRWIEKELNLQRREVAKVTTAPQMALDVVRQQRLTSSYIVVLTVSNSSPS